MIKVTGTFKPTRWDESTLDQISPEVKTSRASMTYAFSGGIDGESAAQSLMFYQHVDATDPHKSTARYVGLQRFTGKLNGKAGSFVVEETGKFDGGAANSTLTIMAGSGTGELAGIEGTGRFYATKDGASCELEYELTGQDR